MALSLNSSPDVDAMDHESEDDKIIRVTSYHRIDGLVQVYGHDLDPQIGACYHTFKNRPEPQPKKPVNGLGDLKLPPEILKCIVDQLSVKDALVFRKVNRLARDVVDDTTGYKIVTQHAPACLKAVFGTGIAHVWRLTDIYHALCQPTCEKCGDAGELVHLPTMTRCCLSCLGYEPTLRVITTNDLAGLAKRNKRTVERSLRVVVKGRIRPFDYRDLANGPLCNMPWRRVEARLRRLTNIVDFTTACAVLRQEKNIDISSDAVAQSSLPFAVSCPLPLFDKKTATSYHALSCKGCALTNVIGPELGVINSEFTREGFLEHFKDCEVAVSIWEYSADGTIDVPDEEIDLVRNNGKPWLAKFMRDSKMKFIEELED